MGAAFHVYTINTGSDVQDKGIIGDRRCQAHFPADAQAGCSCPVAPSPHSPAFPQTATARPPTTQGRLTSCMPSARLQPRGEASGCGLSPFSLEGPPRRERAFPDIRILGILWNYRARGSARKPRRDKGFARLPATVAGRRANGFGQTRQPFAADVATDLGRRCGAPLQRAP